MIDFRAAVEAGDLERMAACLAPDVVFRSPVVYSPYEGREATMTLLRAVFEVFEDFEYVGELATADLHALVFRARVGDRELEGVDLLRLRQDGLVAELTVMIRPLSGLNALAQAMQAKLAAAGA